jgi:hypothetical protein
MRYLRLFRAIASAGGMNSLPFPRKFDVLLGGSLCWMVLNQHVQLSMSSNSFIIFALKTVKVG